MNSINSSAKGNKMNRSIIIKGFGPVKEAKIDLQKKYQIYIGEQASGKSTICKMVFFMQKIRDYTLDFLMDSSQLLENHKNEYYTNYLKFLTKQFMGCFGTTKHLEYFEVKYNWDNYFINVSLNSDGYVRFSFSSKLRLAITSIINESAQMFWDNNMNDSLMDSITKIYLSKMHFSKKLSEIFDNDSDIIYVPAGRSILATMSEQLQDVSVKELDLTMQEFINLIRNTKNKFGAKIPEMVKNYTKTVKGQINNSAVEQAYTLIKTILKADYTSESDGEKMYFDETKWVKLMFSSSGQQEALWILMIVFSIILEKKKAYIIIEEPEAHLFPMAQRHMVELISLLVNATDSRVILTTHSPYILSSANLLLYSDKVENAIPKDNNNVIPKSYRISYRTFDAYRINNSNGNEKYISSLMDKETHMIDVDYIDGVSKINNEDLDKLIMAEIKNEMR